MDSFAVSVFFQSGLYHGTLCASFLTNFHFVTSSLARWRCQSGSTLGRPTTGLFSNSFSISCLLYPVLKAIELLFTGKSLPPMMRIGSTSAQLPWPATCTSGLASFYTFCAPYRSQTEPCVLLGHNVGNSIFPKRSRIGQNRTLLDYPRGKQHIRRLVSVF